MLQLRDWPKRPFLKAPFNLTLHIKPDSPPDPLLVLHPLNTVYRAIFDRLVNFLLRIYDMLFHFDKIQAFIIAKHCRGNRNTATAQCTFTDINNRIFSHFTHSHYSTLYYPVTVPPSSKHGHTIQLSAVQKICMNEAQTQDNLQKIIIGQRTTGSAGARQYWQRMKLFAPNRINHYWYYRKSMANRIFVICNV